jgi:hypothetical protein
MVYDDLIIGSGLTGLAVAYGLPSGRRACVIAGPQNNEFQWYDENCGIPCANNGLGGLGSYWHGVIPMGQIDSSFQQDPCAFTELFHLFYTESIDKRLGKAWQFVPYRPIRPSNHWQRIFRDNPNWLRVLANADKIERKSWGWKVSVGQQSFSSSRIWIAAGALGTPALLERSPGLSGCARKHVSDHVILYLGQLNRRDHPEVPIPKIERSKSGIWMLGAYDTFRKGLLSTKPARFSYEHLDYGIEQRAAFGLPTTGLLSKLFKAPSLGLISESLFNKFGLFPQAEILSAYAQICVKNAYHLDVVSSRLTQELSNIQRVINDYRESLIWPELTPSLRPELFIRGIHLHHSLDIDILKEKGVLANENIEIVDPSCIKDIGPEHHSFKAMVNAYSLAKST